MPSSLARNSGETGIGVCVCVCVCTLNARRFRTDARPHVQNTDGTEEYAWLFAGQVAFYDDGDRLASMILAFAQERGSQSVTEER